MTTQIDSATLEKLLSAASKVDRLESLLTRIEQQQSSQQQQHVVLPSASIAMPPVQQPKYDRPLFQRTSSTSNPPSPQPSQYQSPSHFQQVISPSSSNTSLASTTRPQLDSTFPLPPRFEHSASSIQEREAALLQRITQLEAQNRVLQQERHALVVEKQQQQQNGSDDTSITRSPSTAAPANNHQLSPPPSKLPIIPIVSSTSLYTKRSTRSASIEIQLFEAHMQASQSQGSPMRTGSDMMNGTSNNSGSGSSAPTRSPSSVTPAEVEELAVKSPVWTFQQQALSGDDSLMQSGSAVGAGLLNSTIGIGGGGGGDPPCMMLDSHTTDDPSTSPEEAHASAIGHKRHCSQVLEEEDETLCASSSSTSVASTAGTAPLASTGSFSTGAASSLPASRTSSTTLSTTTTPTTTSHLSPSQHPTKASFRLLRADSRQCEYSHVGNGRISLGVRSTNLVRLNWSPDTPPRNVLIIKKPGDADVTRAMYDISLWLHAHHKNVYVEPSVHLEEELKVSLPFLKTWNDSGTHCEGKKLHLLIDLIVCLGGDGTLLWASNLFKTSVPPVISFSLGSLGFLSPFPIDSFPEALTRVFNGGFHLTLRSRLVCTIVKGTQSLKAMKRKSVIGQQVSGNKCKPDGISNAGMKRGISDPLAVATLPISGATAAAAGDGTTSASAATPISTTTPSASPSPIEPLKSSIVQARHYSLSAQGFNTNTPHYKPVLPVNVASPPPMGSLVQSQQVQQQEQESASAVTVSSIDISSATSTTSLPSTLSVSASSSSSSASSLHPPSTLPAHVRSHSRLGGGQNGIDLMHMSMPLDDHHDGNEGEHQDQVGDGIGGVGTAGALGSSSVSIADDDDDDIPRHPTHVHRATSQYASQAYHAAASAPSNTSGTGAKGGAAGAAPLPSQDDIDALAADDVESYVCMNEVIIDRGLSAYLTLLTCYVDGLQFTNVQADGIIVGTPTGSTAYSLSAGGSMCHPEVPCMLFTPVCPHSLSFRPLLFPDTSTLQIKVSSESRGANCASFDGRHRATLNPGDSLLISMSRWPLPSICRVDGTTDWFDGVRSVLQWNARSASQKAFGSSSSTTTTISSSTSSSSISHNATGGASASTIASSHTTTTKRTSTVPKPHALNVPSAAASQAHDSNLEHISLSAPPPHSATSR